MSSQAHGTASYTEYVAARWAHLFRVAHLLAGNDTDPDDLLQATLVKVFVKWEKVSAADSVDAYVRKMLLNELLADRRLRTRRRDKQHLVAAPDETVDLDPTERLDLWSRISSLPSRQRAVLVLRYYEDLSEAQAAAVLGCSRGTIKSQTHDALRRLRAGLATDEEVAP